jgi:hypothetical protein
MDCVCVSCRCPRSAQTKEAGYAQSDF